MTEIHAFSFWMLYGIVITIISGIYIYMVNKRFDEEHERAERYKERFEAAKKGKR